MKTNVNMNVVRYNDVPKHIDDWINNSFNSLNSQYTTLRKVEEISFEISDSGVLIAALTAKVNCFGWLYIRNIFVDEKFRGQGLGQKLLKDAETCAKEKKCKGVMLETMSFQVPDFYLYQGYEKYADFDKFTGEHSRVYFKKVF